MDLVEIIRGGQDAMDRSDYQLAAAACTHVLDAFPSCLTAHRMLGEAHLEQGQIDQAVEHFNRAITLDPLNVVARLGLGVAAEEKRAMSDAYASYMNAWETNPALDQVRDELVRLRGLLGVGERLHPSRSGLAGIYLRGGQFGRAAAEWRAVLLADPDNPRASTALAEVLWRSGDDAGALAACRAVLEENPENVRALGMLADIDSRRGNPAVSELIERFQFVDPVGEVLALLSEWRDDLDLTFLRREHIVADFNFDSAPVRNEASSLAAAGQNGAPGLGANQFAAPDLWDTLVKDLVPGEDQDGVGLGPADDVMPFSWPDEVDPATSEFASSQPASNSLTDSFGLAGLTPDTAAAVQPEPEDTLVSMSAMPLDLEPAEVEPPGVDDIADQLAASEPAPQQQPEPIQPVAVSFGPSQAPKETFVTADGRVDLTVGWDDLDRQLRDATPNFDNSNDIDDLAAEFGMDGIEPFQMGESSFDDAAWAPFTDDDLNPAGTAPVAADPVAAAPDPVETAPAAPPIVEPHAAAVGPADARWGLDDELLSAIPLQQSSGYTEMLRNVDLEVLPIADSSVDLDPFANPDSAGTPLDVGELMAVTSRDGTSPLSDPESQKDPEFDLGRPDGDQLTASENVAGHSADLEAESDLPFDFEPFDASTLMGDGNDADSANIFMPKENPAPAVVDDLSLDAMIAGLDVRPFSLDDDPTTERADLGGAVDFSDINEAPFDPATLTSLQVDPAPEAENIAPQWQLPDDVQDETAGALGDWGAMAIDDGLVAANVEGASEPAFTRSDAGPLAAEETQLEDVSPIREIEELVEESHVAASEAAAEPVVEDFAAEAPRLPVTAELDERAVAAEALSDELPVVEPLASEVAGGPAEGARVPGTGSFRLSPNAAVVWPGFVNHTSSLMDRGGERGNIFARLKESRQAALAAGREIGDWSLTARPGPPADDVASPVNGVAADMKLEMILPVEQAGAVSKSRRNVGTEDWGLDLKAMRFRLIEEAGAAEEVSQTLETAVAQGLGDPLAMRVLGEAYLKLGRTDQAASQFRNAMLARQRGR